VVTRIVIISNRFQLHCWLLHYYNHFFLFSRTTWVSRYQKGKTNLDLTGARDSEWQWHQQGHMQVCTSLHTDNHASTPPLCFLQAGCPSCHPTNSVKALKAHCVAEVALNALRRFACCYCCCLCQLSRLITRQRFHLTLLQGTSRKSYIASIVTISFCSLLLVYIVCSVSLLTGKN